MFTSFSFALFTFVVFDRKRQLMLAENTLQGCSTETALFTTWPFYLILAIVGLSGQFLRSRGAAVAAIGFLACCLLGS